MREIKFRAWDKLKNCMVLDVPTSNGQGMSWRKAPNSSVTCCIEMEGKTVHCYSDWDFLKEDISLELMQFTGLKDINGKDIYEGDILADDCLSKELYDDGTYLYGVVLFKDGKFLQAYTHKDNAVYYDDVTPSWLKIKVIGNIHENPELLNK